MITVQRFLCGYILFKVIKKGVFVLDLCLMFTRLH